MRSVFAIIVLTILPFCAEAGDPSLKPIDLSSSNKLLFTCTTIQPGWDEFTTVLRADLRNLSDHDNEAVEVLTYYPEEASYYPDTRELEILNHFGLFRADIDQGYSFNRIPYYPSFKQGHRIPGGKILPVAGSPDGRWILIQEPTGSVTGHLYLYNTRTDTRSLISDDHSLVFQNNFALWSDDSKYFIYSRNNLLYYMDIQSVENSRISDESHRVFGKGNLSSVQWMDADIFFYMTGYIVNMISASELSSRSFYSNLVSVGSVLGRIPLDFDFNMDQFWVSPDGQSVLLLKGGGALFLFKLEIAERDVQGQSSKYPCLLLPKTKRILQLWWRDNGDIYLLAGGKTSNNSQTSFYQLDAGRADNLQFKLKKLTNIRQIVPSPDGTSLGILEDTGVSIRSTHKLSEIKYINHPDPRKVVWVDSDRIIIAGSHHIESVLWRSNERTFITLSQVDEIGYDIDENVASVSNGQHYRWNTETQSWKEVAKSTGYGIQTSGLETRSFRVYMDTKLSSRGIDRVLIRDIAGNGNRRLLNFKQDTWSSSEIKLNNDVQTGYDERVFNNGSRIRQREIALVFNAVDNDVGLGEVLNTLAEYNLQSTFFIGGDFIRRNPESTRYISSEGHEIGSLFYTHMDMADYRYRIDESFVARGLARNEDEFHRATDSELVNIWHAPWYVISDPILDATENMHYLYVGRDIDALDWVSLDASTETRVLYRSSLELVRKILDEVRPGSIVPIRIGLPGKREDYLFSKLDLLINGILRQGYDIVTVGELRRHAL